MIAPRILSIAGSDNSGGAGIQADIKTITMLGGHAMTAITAVTVQTSRAVIDIHPVPVAVVAAQIESCTIDTGVDAVKLGMLGSAELARAVADELVELAVPIVLDPVMVASSGDALADADTVAEMHRLARIATLVTPNLPELALLAGRGGLTDAVALLAQARELAARWGTAVLMKGGHGGGEILTDRLIDPDGTVTQWSDPRIATTHTHGTGCTLSAAIATLLGRGETLAEAVVGARRFVRLAMREAPGFVAANGAMGHAAVRLDAALPGPMLNQVTLPCTDLDASCAFYRALGFVPVVISQTNGYARFETPGGATLSVSRNAGSAGGVTTYFECADLDARCGALAARGVVFDQPPQDQPWGWREAHLHDPAGNRLCFYLAGENRRFPARAVPR